MSNSLKVWTCCLLRLCGFVLRFFGAVWFVSEMVREQMQQLVQCQWFCFSATALEKPYLSRNLRGNLPSLTVGSDPVCHMCVGIKICRLNI